MKGLSTNGRHRMDCRRRDGVATRCHQITGGAANVRRRQEGENGFYAQPMRDTAISRDIAHDAEAHFGMIIARAQHALQALGAG